MGGHVLAMVPAQWLGGSMGLSGAGFPVRRPAGRERQACVPGSRTSVGRRPRSAVARRAGWLCHFTLMMILPRVRSVKRRGRRRGRGRCDEGCESPSRSGRQLRRLFAIGFDYEEDCLYPPAEWTVGVSDVTGRRCSSGRAISRCRRRDRSKTTSTSPARPRGTVQVEEFVGAQVAASRGRTCGRCR